MDAAQHLVRRARRDFSLAHHGILPVIPHDLKAPNDNETRALQALQDGLEKRQRMTPAEMAQIQASASAAAAAAQQTTARTIRTVTNNAPQTTATHEAYSFSNKYGNQPSSAAPAATTSSAAAVRSSAVAAVPSSRAASSSSAVRSPASSAVPTSTAPSSAVRAVPSASTNTVRTITQTTPAASSTSSAPPVASSAAAAADSSSGSAKMSTGATAGIVVAALVGLVVVGSFIGWLYRKHASRKYSTKAPWSKIEDDDITPFPPNEKFMSDDDIYGPPSVPVIGSRRALALARQNAFNADGSFRPDSEMVLNDGPNRAGVGSGSMPNYGAYPNMAPANFADYPVDPQGRPYNPNAGRTPISPVYHDAPHAFSAPGNSRQLVGPNGYPQPELSPMTLGRPAPPTNNFAIAQHEDFADLPEPHTPTMMEPQSSPYTPRTATTIGEWAGEPAYPGARSRVSMTTPRARVPSDGSTSASSLGSPTDFIRPPPPAATTAFPVAHASASPSGLPSFEPMSPLMGDFELRRNSTQPLAMYANEASEQKRMYGEVASAAGVREPPTPKSAHGLDNSKSSYDTASSFSAHEPMPRLPSFTVNAPEPYIHGRPLSPLAEVSTPATTSTVAPPPSSSLLHGQNEPNPFERTLLAPRQAAAAPPYSATSSTGATSFPSPAYPPPSPGGMSVPGSVTDSPRTWRGEPSRHRQSIFDEDDAYGGI